MKATVILAIVSPAVTEECRECRAKSAETCAPRRRFPYLDALPALRARLSLHPSRNTRRNA